MSPAGVHVWCVLVSLVVGLVSPMLVRWVSLHSAPLVLRKWFRRYLEARAFTTVTPNASAPHGTPARIAAELDRNMPAGLMLVVRKATAHDLSLGTVRVTLEIGAKVKR